jgi:hypothetical protein
MRKLPRIPPPPLEGPRIEKHFRAMWQVLWNKMQLATDLSPTTVGSVREFFVREFLSLHLPGDLSVGTGHVLAERDESQQIDVLVFRRSGLALPMGNVSLVFPEGLVACMEVKSTLTKEDFRGQIATMFGDLPPPTPGEPIPLKAVIAVQLENSSQHRSLLEKWRKCEGELKQDALPDIVIILDNAPVIRGGALECLKNLNHFGGEEGALYKLGDYKTQKWVGLMLLVFEIAQRASGADWSQYINRLLPKSTKFEKLQAD